MNKQELVGRIMEGEYVEGDLRGVILDEADLKGADLYKADLRAKSRSPI